MLSLINEIVKTWRSIASVFLAYGLIGLLFFYKPEALNWAIGLADEGYDQSRELTMGISQQAAALFGLTINPGSVFVTLMILFARVVVLSLVLWVFKGLGGLIFGGAEKVSRF